MGGWVDRWMDRWVGGWVGGWTQARGIEEKRLAANNEKGGPTDGLSSGSQANKGYIHCDFIYIKP